MKRETFDIKEMNESRSRSSRERNRRRKLRNVRVIQIVMGLVLFLTLAVSAFGLQNSVSVVKTLIDRSGGWSIPVLSALPGVSALLPHAQQAQQQTSTDQLASSGIQQLEPGAMKRVSGGLYQRFQITGNQSYASLYTTILSDESIPSNTALLLEDSSGKEIAENTDCGYVSVYACLEHVFLEKNKTYVLTVLDELGGQVHANVSYVQEGLVPDTVTDLKLIGRSETALRIGWMDPNLAGRVKWYKLQIKKSGTDWFDFRTLTKPETVIYDLTPLKTYQFRVIAVSPEGMFSEVSLPMEASTCGVAKPGQTQTLNSGRTEYLLVGDGQNYDLIWSTNYFRDADAELIGPNGQKITDQTNVARTSDGLRMRLGKLSKGEAYTLRFYFEYGNGAVGQFAVQAADEIAPEVPVITYSRPNRNNAISSVTLCWNPVKDDNGLVTYEISRDSGLTMKSTYNCFDDATAKLGVTHEYRVRSLDVLNNASAWSDPINVEVPVLQTYLFYIPVNEVPNHYATFSLADYFGNDSKLGYNKPIQTSSKFTGYAMVEYTPDQYWSIKTLGVYAQQTGVGGQIPLPNNAPLKGGTYVVSNGQIKEGEPSVQTALIFYPVDATQNERTIFLHFRTNDKGWTTYPGYKITTNNLSRFYQIEIPLNSGQSITEAAFLNERGYWDNNDGKNYSFTSGVWTMQSGKAIKGDYSVTPNPSYPTNIGIEYCNLRIGEPVYVHFKTNISGWTTSPGYFMSKSSETGSTQCNKITIAYPGNASRIQEAAFYLPWRNVWDNNNSKNYSFSGDSVKINGK